MNETNFPGPHIVEKEKSAVYFFCFANPHGLPVIEGTGVDGQSPIFVENFWGIAAVLSWGSLEDFCGPLAETNMQNLSWVGPRACRHEEVVEEVMRNSPVLPARFGTLFSSVQKLDELVRKHHDTVSVFLERVADKEEWAVRCLLNRARARKALLSTVLARHEEDMASCSPGMRYFQEHRIWVGIEKELNSWVRKVCEEVVDGLSQDAAALSQRKILGKRETQAETIANWAFLLPRTTLANFFARIGEVNAQYAHRGLHFDRSGPWPPYSFCPALGMEANP